MGGRDWSITSDAGRLGQDRRRAGRKMGEDETKDIGAGPEGEARGSRPRPRELARRSHELRPVGAKAEPGHPGASPPEGRTVLPIGRKRRPGHGGSAVSGMAGSDAPVSSAGEPPPAFAERSTQGDPLTSLYARRALRPRTILGISALVGIVLPTVLAGIYYFVVASDQYVSEARFAVRSNDAGAADVLGMITGMPTSTVTSDAYIVCDYILSRQMVETLEHQLPFRKMYSSDKADFLSRVDPGISIDRLVTYWNNYVNVYYDSTKQTITLRVTAFTPNDAARIAGNILDSAENLVNGLASESNRDAIRFAATEVERENTRIKQAEADMIAFRSEHHDLDPNQTATAAQSLVAQLRTERAQLESERSSMAGYLADSAPSLQILKTRIQATDDEISRVQAQLAGGQGEAASPSAAAPANPSATVSSSAAKSPGSNPSVAGQVAKYEELTLDQNFAQTAYEVALASLERAHSDADRARSYFALYMTPSVPQYSLYPRRILSVVFVFLLACIFWSLGTIGVLVGRDHMV